MTDIQLINDYKAGNTNAFGLIYEKYIEQIYKFVYFKVSSKDIAEDIVSETFIKGLSSLEKFVPKSESSLKSWIYTIAYNNVKNYYRTKNENIDIEDVFNLGLEECFGEDLDNKEKLKEVIVFLQTLKPDQREILIMRIWNNLSYREISEITGKSINNCKKIVSRVLIKVNANLATIVILMMI